MNASFLDLRKNTKKILSALEHNERVTLTYRGKKKALLIPCTENKENTNVADHKAVGMWKDRDDIEDVSSYVRELRKGRF
ncbi:MAG: type II toxin-antitoxin system Phd/YefM family antitoxin [Planctomycetota bacterium]|jgi:antitoxin (DNA-binding transcriptional repressor) of toxin-antitoxin stability system